AMSARASVASPRRRGDALIGKALATLDRRLRRVGESLGSPYAVREFLQLRLAELEHEVFMVLFLDSQNRMIEWQEMFRGSITQTSVYPREIVKAALACNAFAVIFAHNHPSGVSEPSPADRALTGSLKAALALVDVAVLDHFIVAGREHPLSFAERGLL
ncbi:MAG: DNA repair protein RadC, partial [Rhodocyclaceae bacterium]|nr:DNA repair protein RadC [Rhodocyclaceae bacterium]